MNDTLILDEVIKVLGRSVGQERPVTPAHAASMIKAIAGLREHEAHLKEFFDEVLRLS